MTQRQHKSTSSSSLRLPERITALIPAQYHGAIARYCKGGRNTIIVRKLPPGTPFQQMVWAALVQIPFGTRLTYKDVAVRIGRPNAIRAVGNAVGKNPWPIVIPCHRVLRGDGTVGGYAFGVALKRALLRHEQMM